MAATRNYPFGELNMGRIVPSILRGVLASRGMAQRDLAAGAGLSKAYVSDLLNGRRGLSVAAAVRVERALGVPARELMIRQLEEELEAERAKAEGTDARR